MASIFKFNMNRYMKEVTIKMRSSAVAAATCAAGGPLPPRVVVAVHTESVGRIRLFVTWGICPMPLVDLKKTHVVSPIEVDCIRIAGAFVRNDTLAVCLVP